MAVPKYQENVQVMPHDTGTRKYFLLFHVVENFGLYYFAVVCVGGGAFV